MAKDKKSNFRLMGFGHRVYKNFDPRCIIIKKACDKSSPSSKSATPCFDVAQQLEDVALSDPYFIERKLYPTSTSTSGVIYRALNIPVQMFNRPVRHGPPPRLDRPLGRNARLPTKRIKPPAANLYWPRSGNSCRIEKR